MLNVQHRVSYHILWIKTLSSKLFKFEAKPRQSDTESEKVLKIHNIWFQHFKIVNLLKVFCLNMSNVRKKLKITVNLKNVIVDLRIPLILIESVSTYNTNQCQSSANQRVGRVKASNLDQWGFSRDLFQITVGYRTLSIHWHNNLVSCPLDLAKGPWILFFGVWLDISCVMIM